MDVEADRSKALYGFAWQKFTSEPTLLFGRLLKAEGVFLSKVGPVMLTGYSGRLPFPKLLWMLVAAGGAIFALRGLTWVLVKHRERYELSFWILMLASIVLSAPFLIFDDGWRAICTSFVLLALLFSSGFATPTTQLAASEGATAAPVWKIGGLVLAAVLCFAAPAIAYRADILDSRRYRSIEVRPDENIFFGGGREAGFVVLADDVSPLKDVPSISYTSFKAIVQASGIEQYEPLIGTPSAVQPPFAIFAAVSATKRQSGLLIAPTEVMIRTDVSAWKIRSIDGPMWMRVVEATPADR
jgi:hypothetical protein